MKGSEGRILRSGDRSRGNKDGEREDEESIGVANTKVCQRCSEVLRIGKLLLPIHTELYVYSQTIT